MITVKLFRFSLPEEKTVLYIYSIRSNQKYLRKQFYQQDSGDIPFALYKKLYEEGTIEQITSLNQVSSEEKNWFPYSCWTLEQFELEIQMFFNNEAVDKYYNSKE